MSEYKKQHYLNSQSRDYGNNDQFVTITAQSITDLKLFRLNTAIIPRTFYTFNSFNNVLSIQEDVGASFSITITPGNYDLATFKTTIEGLLNTASTNSYVYTLTYSEVTNKITLSCTGLFQVLLSGTAQLILGFSTTSALALSVSADKVQRVTSYPECLYIRGNISNDGQYVNQSITSDVIAKVPVSVARNQTIYYENVQEDFYENKGQNNMYNFYCSYVDINNPAVERVVDFNGADWGVGLEYVLERELN